MWKTRLDYVSQAKNPKPIFTCERPKGFCFASEKPLVHVSWEYYVFGWDNLFIALPTLISYFLFHSQIWEQTHFSFLSSPFLCPKEPKTKILLFSSPYIRFKKNQKKKIPFLFLPVTFLFYLLHLLDMRNQTKKIFFSLFLHLSLGKNQKIKKLLSLSYYFFSLPSLALFSHVVADQIKQ